MSHRDPTVVTLLLCVTSYMQFLQQLRRWLSDAWKPDGFYASVAFATTVTLEMPKLTNRLQLDFNAVTDGEW